MKLSYSFFLKLGGICCGIGLLLSGIGYAISDSRSFALTYTDGHWHYNDISNKLFESEINEPFTSIDIHAASLDIIVKKGDAFSAHLKTLYQDAAPSVKNNTLYFNQNDTVGISCISVNFTQSEAQFLEITIPEDTALETVSIHTDSGDISIEPLKCAAISVESISGDIQAGAAADTQTYTCSSGDLRIQDIQCKNLTIGAESGDLALERADVMENADLNTMSGDVTFDDVRAQSLYAKAESGDIKMKNITCSQIQAQTDTGDIAIALKGINSPGYALKTDIGDIHVNGSYFENTVNDGAEGIRAQTDTGDIVLEY